jgi:hypothetical protein
MYRLRSSLSLYFVCLLRCPHHTGGCAGGVEAGVGLVAFVRGAELPVDAGAEFCLGISVCCAYVRGPLGRGDGRIGETRLGSRGSCRWRWGVRELESGRNQASWCSKAPEAQLLRSAANLSTPKLVTSSKIPGNPRIEWLKPLQHDVALLPVRKKQLQYVPLSLGSFELENRLWEKAPLRWLTLSAEKDMLYRAMTSFC